MGYHFLLQCMKVKSGSKVAQSCLTLSYPMDCSLPGSSIHGIFQAQRATLSPIPEPPHLDVGGILPLAVERITCFSSVAQLCPTVCDPMDCSTPGFPVHHQPPDLAQTHVHQVSPSSKATLWGKAQHEGELPPPCIVRKDPRLPHTARRGA